MNSVYINKVSKFLPNRPVSNATMEQYLGKINDKESKAKNIVLRNNGIETRYYALDEQGNPTHTNAEITAEAIKQLCDDSLKLEDIELISCGTSSPDYLMPSHAVMVHGELKNGITEVNTAAGNCCAGMNALKYGYFSVMTGNTKNAVCTGSERMSSWMLANHFDQEVKHLESLQEKPIIGFQKDFLRWMLSDGAGAVLLESTPKGAYPLKIEWIESYSYAHEIETCMYAGAEKKTDGSLTSFSDINSNEWLNKSIFSVKQDTRLLDKYIAAKGVESVQIAFKKHQLTPEDITYLLPHVSSHYFIKGLFNALKEANFEFAEERWYTNLKKVGNVGAGSVFLMLEELVASNTLKKGDKILLCVPESARFSYAYALLTVQ